jgi:hypothetical protein
MLPLVNGAKSISHNIILNIILSGLGFGKSHVIIVLWD